MPNSKTWRTPAYNTIDCAKEGSKYYCSFVESHGLAPLAPSPPPLDGFQFVGRGAITRGEVDDVLQYHHYTRLECKLYEPNKRVLLTCKSY